MRGTKIFLGFHLKYTLFLSYINETNFLDRFSKNFHTQNFMKILPVGAELFRADGRTDMTKLVVAFRNFANAPKQMTPTVTRAAV